MKNLVFLHGSGADCKAYHNLMSEIAQILDAELIIFNAPFPHPDKQNKFVWFNKVLKEGRRDAVEKDYWSSVDYIKQQLENLKLNPADTILIGHSQGGGMAAHMGLELNLKAVISICGDLPYNITYTNKAHTPIFWFEAAKDGYIDASRKASYKMLENLGVELHYQILPTSTHKDFEQDILSIFKTPDLLNFFK